jgi:hypothetical protein
MSKLANLNSQPMVLTLTFLTAGSVSDVLEQNLVGVTFLDEQ